MNCEGGTLFGFPCEEKAEHEIEWVPEWLRETHAKAGGCAEILQLCEYCKTAWEEDDEE